MSYFALYIKMEAIAPTILSENKNADGFYLVLFFCRLLEVEKLDL